MAVVIITKKLTREDVQKALEEYPSYIKITIDTENEIVAIGGEYHADAELILVKNYGSKNSNIWGGGYNLDTKMFETNAMVNIKPIISSNNPEITDPIAKEKFLMLVNKVLKDIESFV